MKRIYETDKRKSLLMKRIHKTDIYETDIYILHVKCKPDLPGREIIPVIDWDGLEELKVKSWSSSGS